MTYTRHRDTRDTLQVLDHLEIDGHDNSDNDEMLANKFGVKTMSEAPRWKRFQCRVWKLFDEPYSSTCAKAVNVLTIIFIIASICTFCAGTHPNFMENLPRPPDEQQFHNETAASYQQAEFIQRPHYVLFLIECVCNAWFTIELLTRFIACPNKKLFMKEAVNIIDFVATINFYVTVFQRVVIVTGIVKDILDVFAIIQVMRIFKLSRHHPGLKILYLTLNASARELFLLILFLIFGVVIFSAMVYFAEKMEKKAGQFEHKNDFNSIIDGFWWSVVTMTTVGYGDMVPRSYSGMLVGMLCALAGVLTTSLPIPVIVSNFTIFYQHMEARKKLPKRSRRVFQAAMSDKTGRGGQSARQQMVSRDMALKTRRVAITGDTHVELCARASNDTQDIPLLISPILSGKSDSSKNVQERPAPPPIKIEPRREVFNSDTPPRLGGMSPKSTGNLHANKPSTNSLPNDTASRLQSDTCLVRSAALPAISTRPLSLQANIERRYHSASSVNTGSSPVDSVLRLHTNSKTSSISTILFGSTGWRDDDDDDENSMPIQARRRPRKHRYRKRSIPNRHSDAGISYALVNDCALNRHTDEGTNLPNDSSQTPLVPMFRDIPSSPDAIENDDISPLKRSDKAVVRPELPRFIRNHSDSTNGPSPQVSLLPNGPFRKRNHAAIRPECPVRFRPQNTAKDSHL